MLTPAMAMFTIPSVVFLIMANYQGENSMICKPASGRVETDDPEAIKKQDPFDFALWKGAKPGEL
jgi:cysteinyl-tRNA synthetase